MCDSYWPLSVISLWSQGLWRDFGKVFELCFHKYYTWELTWMLQLGFLSKLYFMAHWYRKVGSWHFMLKSSSCEEQHLNQFNDVVFLQFHVNKLIQFALFCSFLLSFLAFFTEWLWIVLGCHLPCTGVQHLSVLIEMHFYHLFSNLLINYS